MGLFKKVRSKDKGEGEEATEATLASPLSQSPTPVEEPEATPEEATADGPGTDETETAPGSEGLDLEGVLGPLEGDDQVTGDPDVDEDSESSSDEEGDDDLMDIFASQEEEDVDMTALTDSLEEIDTESLIAEARDVSSNLRELLAK